MNALNGMSVLAKLAPDPAEMRDIGRLSLKILDGSTAQPVRRRAVNDEES